MRPFIRFLLIVHLLGTFGCATLRDAIDPNCRTLPKVTGPLKISECAPRETGFPEANPPEFNSCRIGDIVYTARMLPRSEANDGYLEILRSNGTIQRVDVLPHTKIVLSASDKSPALACDEAAQRVYYGNFLMGYLVSFDQDGHELWRAELPEYDYADSDPLSTSKEPTTLFQVIAEHDRLGQIYVSDQYLLVSIRSARNARQAIYHRAGRLIGLVGPWQGFPEVDENQKAIPAPARKWRLGLIGSGTNEYEERPITMVLDASGDPTASLVRHFLARLLPGKNEVEYNLIPCRTGAMTPDYLGKEYNQKFARISGIALMAFGSPRMAEILNRKGLSTMLADPHPNSPEWMKRTESAFVSAGIDVEFIRIVNAHPEWLQN